MRSCCSYRSMLNVNQPRPYPTCTLHQGIGR
nr:MAG TPA: hypothetical protein [Caudoviricetes sp.]